MNTYILRFYKENDSDSRKAVIGNIFCITTIFNIIFITIIGIIYVCIDLKLDLKVDFSPYILLTLIIVFFDVIDMIPLAIIRVEGRANLFFMLSITKSVLIFVLNYIFIAILNKGVVSKYYTTFIVSLAFYITYLIFLKNKMVLKFSIRIIKNILSFSLPLVPGVLSLIMMDFLTRIVLERYLDLSFVGMYSIAYTLGFAVNVFIRGGYQAIEPKIFSICNDTDFLVKSEKIFRYFLYIVISFSFSFMLFSKEILYIFTSSKYYGLYDLVNIITLSVLTTAFLIVEGMLLIVKSKTKVLSSLYFIAAALNFILNSILVPKFGIMIVGINMFISYLTITIIGYVYIRLLYSELRKFLFKPIFMYFSVVLFISIYNKIFTTFSLYEVLIKFIVLISILLFSYIVNMRKIKILLNNLR